jgi:hypothetical protein
MMPHFVISGYLPEHFDPSAMDDAMVERIHALNREMDAAGITRFSGGLGASHTCARSPTATWSSPRAPTSKPRSMSAES